ncbi:MAG: PilZ domain-containing protein [Sphingomonadales bacterium]|nr:PilZ domain-containing protein [Sphingomonadales bacterium]
MSVLIIRAHKRFAVVRKVRLCKPGRRGVDGLLIELSLDGCRISHAAATTSFALGDLLTLRVTGTKPIAARVRWLREGAIGLRFEHPLHISGLEALIRLCRGEAEAPLRAYGT